MNESLNNTIYNISTNTNITENLTLFGQNIPITNSPTIDIFLISLIVSLFVTLVNKYLSDQVKIKALRKEMKSLQKEMRSVMVKDPEKAKKIQAKIMQKNLENMRHAFNPRIMLITMFPMFFVFYLIKVYYSHLGEFFKFPIFGWEFGWLGSYIIFSIFNSLLLKKILDVA
jgi:uncharacterized membrane protein (DUF106 family)